MSDVPSVSLTPKPGSDLWIVSQMTCPAGHVVQEAGERPDQEVSLRMVDKSLVWCEECEHHYSVVQKLDVVEAHQRLLERARERGIIDG